MTARPRIVPRATMLGLAILITALAALGAAPAQATPILDWADASELAQDLLEADEEQGICYGWHIVVNDDHTGEFTGTEQGSSGRGPGERLSPAECDRWVELQGTVEYVSNWCECEDSAAITIASNLSSPPQLEQLATLGYDANDLLSEDADDVALMEMTALLPLLAAERGGADFVPFEPQEGPVPASDVPTNTPGSDWWRMYWWIVPLAAVLAFGPLCVVVPAFRTWRANRSARGAHGRRRRD